MTEPLTPYWVSPVATLYLGSAATVLAQLPAESVDMCVTSPPFWGLRDYKVDGQIGLEKTPELWLERILAVFREVRRVLRPWGTLWCEIGDSYWGGKGQSGQKPATYHYERQALELALSGGHSIIGGPGITVPKDGKHPTIKPLDLVGIPFRLALALQADGWWLRSVIIWDKPAPMPESVAGWRWVKCKVKVRAQKAGVSPARIGVGMATGTKPQRDAPGGEWQGDALWADCPGCPKCLPNGGLVLRKGSWRPTEAHSYILMLAKGVPYACFGEAVREPSTMEPGEIRKSGRIMYGGLREETSGWGEYGFASPSGRNLRSVWSDISPEPSNLPHFATFPTALPEKCILAGTSEWGNCPRCGMAWAPVIETKPRQFNREPAHVPGNTLTKIDSTGWEPPEPTVIGWRPSCSCGLTERVPAVVLDPFTGTSSTGVAAQRLGRKFIGIDLSERYLQLSIKRLEAVNLPLGL